MEKLFKNIDQVIRDDYRSSSTTLVNPELAKGTTEEEVLIHHIAAYNKLAEKYKEANGDSDDEFEGFIRENILSGLYVLQSKLSKEHSRDISLLDTLSALENHGRDTENNDQLRMRTTAFMWRAYMYDVLDRAKKLVS